MKTTRNIIKPFLLLFALILIVSSMAIATLAADTVYVTDWDELSQALSASDRTDIIVKNKIAVESKTGFETVVINGTKKLDLAGQTINYTYKNSDGDEKFTKSSNHSVMFRISSGAELTVTDSSAEKLGMIEFEAHTPDVYDFNMSAIRDIFEVYGTLIVDNGIINAGHEQKQFAFALSLGGGRLYTGNVYQQVYGTAVTLREKGRFIANGGAFFGRGGALTLSKTLMADYRGCVVRIEGTQARATINGGSFYSNSGAHIFSQAAAGTLKVNNGYFETKGRSAALINYGGYVVADCDEGYFVIGSEAWKSDLEKKIVILDDEIYIGKSALSTLDLYTGKSSAHILTALDFESQTPEMPYGKRTTGLGKILKGTSKEFYIKEKELPAVLENQGYIVYSLMNVYDVDNEELVQAFTSQQEKRFNCSQLETGNYSVTESIILSKNKKLVSRLDNTFLFEIYNDCSHSFTETANTATCIQSGEKTETCTKCGETRTVASPALGHTFEELNDWSYNGQKHWYYCYRCDSEFSADYHSFDADGICNVCDFDKNCSYDNAMDTEYDEKYHWWPCDHGESCPGNGQLEKELHYVRKISDGGFGGIEPTTEYNCRQGYVCGGCGEYFGEKYNHNWVLDEARSYASTSAKNGLNVYVCAYDGGTDIKGNTINCSAEMKIVLPKHRCEYDYDNPVNNTATCTQDGYQTILCKICNQGIYVNTYALGHNFEFIKGTATCSEGGTIDRYECTRCKKMSSDPEGENIITGYISDYPIDHKMNWHASVPATCEEYEKNAYYKCEYCQETFADEDGNTKITVENEAAGYAPHTLTFVEGTASCNKAGILEHFACTVCQKIFFDHEGKNEVTVEAVTNKKLNHSIIYSDPKPATCIAFGHKYSYGTCNNCRGLFVRNSDNDNTVEAFDFSAHAIEKLGHSFTKQVIDEKYLVSAATEDSPAVYKYGCIRCDAISPDQTFTYGEKLSVLGKSESVTSVQSTTAVKLIWSAVEGADGYSIFMKVSGNWVYQGVTTRTEAVIGNLQSGTAYTFAIRAGAKRDGAIVWADDYATLTVTTKFTRPEKVIAQQNNVAIKLIWTKVDVADGYAIYQKNDNGSWKYLGVTTKTEAIINNLTPGKIYTFAVRAAAKSGNGIVLAKDYTTIQTATKPLAPTKAAATQNENAILLRWTAVSGATHYRVLVKTAGGWQTLGHVTNTSALLNGLTPGTRYTYGIVPVILTQSGVITGNYIIYVAATAPKAPVTTATSPSQGKINISWTSVDGAEAYQLYYKEGNGSYKLYRNYFENTAVSFSNLRSGTKYTFAVRAAKNTSGGWIFGGFTPVEVTVQ